MLIKSVVEVGEVYRNAQRPAILASIRSILTFYGLTNAFDQVYLNGEAEVARQIFSSNTDGLRSDTPTDMLLRRKLFVVAEVNPSIFNTGYGNSGMNPNNPPVWYSKDTNTYMIPGYEGREISVECNCHFNTRAEAINFVNRINRASSRQLAEFTFSTRLHYPINPSIIEFLNDLYTLSVKANQYTGDFGQWMFDNALAPLSVITNEGNRNPLPVIERRIDDVNVIFEEPSIGLSRKGDYTGKHIATFRYKFYWQEMVEWQLQYPIMVYQQPIPSKWLPVPQFQYINGFIKNAFYEYQYANQIYHNRSENAPFYYRFPDNDPWYPTDTEWLSPQASLLTTLENVEKQTLINIKEIPNWTWRSGVLDYITKCGNNIFNRHESIIHVKVYSEDLQVLYTQLELDADGNINFLRPPTMENAYRVCIFIDYDLKNLSADGIGLILKDDTIQQTFLPSVFYWHDWSKIPNSNILNDRRAQGPYPDQPPVENNASPDDGIKHWISTKDQWLLHAESNDLGPGTNRFNPVLYSLDNQYFVSRGK